VKKQAMKKAGSVLISNQEAFNRKVRQENRKAHEEKPKLGRYKK
jgi:hypothetical protein